MTPQQALLVVQSYYAAYRAPDQTAIAAALNQVLDAAISIDSPIVQAKFGGVLTGPAALATAVELARFLKGATLEAAYATVDGTGAAALIHFPSPVGEIYQSEHFEFDPDTGKITRLRSFYDPRKLLQPKA